MASAAPIVSIQNVSKLFGGSGGQTHALSKVSLDIAPGEFVSLLGPSGCGKSTLLRLVADLIEPSEGQISIKGKSPRRARQDREYGIVFQSPVLYDWRSVLRNVQLPLEVMRVAPDERDARAREMLALVGLKDFERHYPWQLSGGMQQRVSIARALSFKPSILLMDEPFGALDELTRERMNTELLNIWSKTDTTVIFVTHSIAEAVFLSSRVVVMSPRPGRIEKIVSIDLPRPRTFETREQPRFFELVTDVREGLREV
ncbi:MAG: ABC transporter ATP-binding protein [Anaerolineales bacterium]